jgi:galactokinase/mevalonate kinase-like predicted kinase
MTTEPASGRVGRGVASARAALAGNPSDGYGGAVLALALPARRATARAWRSEAALVDPPSELVTATVARSAAELGPAGRDVASVAWDTSIPRAVGLGGSSAIVVATLRALCDLWSVALEPLAMAELALSIEVDELGIAAGLQDRIAQTHDGLTFMDFGRSSPATVRTLDPALLPPLLIAWQTDSGGHSGEVHAPLRHRHADGEPVVLDAMRALTNAAHDAARAVSDGDHAALRTNVDASFDARRSMLALDPRHVEMIETARAAGAAANYAGSGGAIVAVCLDAGHRTRVDTGVGSGAALEEDVTAPRPDICHLSWNEVKSQP